MIKRDLVLGPWVGGLNTRDNPQDVSDSELTIADNIIVTDNGSLRTRPGLVHCSNSLTFTNTSQGSGRIAEKIVKYWLLGPNAPILVESADYSTTLSMNVSRLYAWNHGLKPTVNDREWVYITVPQMDNSIRSVGWSQSMQTEPSVYRSNIMACKWETRNAFVFWYNNGYVGEFFGNNLANDISAGTATNGTTIFNSNAMVVATADGYNPTDMFMFKERCFIFMGQTVYYSKATDPLTWTSPDGGFFRVATPIRSVVDLNDALYICCDDALYRFTYQLDPRSDGYLTRLTPLVNGAGLAEYQGRLFVYDSNGVHELMGSELRKISGKLQLPSPLTLLNALPIKNSFDFPNDPLYQTLSVVDNYMLLVSNTTDVYVYHFPSDSWVHWTAPAPVWGRFKPIPELTYAVAPTGSSEPYNTNSDYYKGYLSESGCYFDPRNFVVKDAVQNQYQWWPPRIDTGVRSHTTKPFHATMQTKAYGFSSPVDIKRHHRTIIDREMRRGVLGGLPLTEKYQLNLYTSTPAADSSGTYTVISGNAPELGRLLIPGSYRFRLMSWKYEGWFDQLSAGISDAVYLGDWSNAEIAAIVMHIYTTVSMHRPISDASGVFSGVGSGTPESL